MSKTLEKLRQFEHQNAEEDSDETGDSEEADIQRALREARQNAQSDGGREAALLHGERNRNRGRFFFENIL